MNRELFVLQFQLIQKMQLFFLFLSKANEDPSLLRGLVPRAGARSDEGNEEGSGAHARRARARAHGVGAVGKRGALKALG